MSVQRDQPARDDPVSLLSAAARIRHSQRPAARREARMRLAASRLVEAVAAALARDHASVPVAVRRTAAALAAEATRPERRTGDFDSAECPGPRPAGSRPPFTASIRLGRMG